MKANNLVFVIENDHFYEKRIKENFKNDREHVFVYFKTSTTCINQLYRHPIAVLVDYDLNSLNTREKDALKILAKIKELEHDTQVVFFSTIDSKNIAEDVIKHGAYDYVVVNENSFLRLQKTLANIQHLVDNKNASAAFRKKTWIAFAIYTLIVIVIMILYFMGYMHEREGQLIEPW